MKQYRKRKKVAVKRRRKRGVKHHFSDLKEKKRLDPIPLKTLCEIACQEEVLATTEILKKRRNKETVLELASNACWFLSGLVDRSSNKKNWMCSAGCSFCCRTTRLYLAPVEVLLIAEYLRVSCATEELDNVRNRIAHTAHQVSNMSDEEQALAKVPCALLSQDGRCSVYEVRPIRCRAYCSLSKDKCREAFDTESLATTTPIDAFAYAMGIAVSEGLECAVKGAGLDGEQYELHNSLLCALSNKDSAELWIQGKELFKGCLQAIRNRKLIQQ
jgi:Fe-S-cluster containining protein